MKRLYKILSVAFVCLLALSAFAVLSPRAVHAVIATFVQVVNTPTTAVPTTLAPAASQIYHSQCTALLNGASNATCSFSAVPPGETLFGETFTIAAATNGVDALASFIQAPDGVDFIIPLATQSARTLQGAYAGRISFASGTPTCGLNLVANVNGGSLLCSISGYLAPVQ